MFLSIVVPAYNEEDNLEKNILSFYKYLDSQKFDSEIIIVNDGSSDQTKRVASELTKKHQSIHLLDLKHNQGKGKAIKTGLSHGRGQYRMFLDADNATSIDHLDLAFAHMSNKADIIIGSRNKSDAKNAEQTKKQILIKRILGTCGNKLIKIFTGQNINDTQCGFKIFSQKAVETIIPKSKINRWAIDIELLLLAKKNNYKIHIIPVQWRCGDVSRVGFKGYLNTLRELILIKYYDLRNLYK